MKIECTPTGTWIVRQSYKGQSLVAIAPSRAEALGALIDLIDVHRCISTPSEDVARLCEEERSRTAEHYSRLAKEAASRLNSIEPSEGEK